MSLGRRAAVISVVTIALSAVAPAPARAVIDSITDAPSTPECALVGGKAKRTMLTMDDGVALEAWLAVPDCPHTDHFPVIVSPGPYYGQCYHSSDTVCDVTPGAAGWWQDPIPDSARVAAQENTLGFPPIRLVEAGYALLYVSVRGTGGSGGCFGLLSEQEQQDQVTVVEWAADQDNWSTGRVAMIGLSYGTSDAFAAAVRQPRGLATTITAGVVTDWYTMMYSPQGAHVIEGAFSKTALYPGSTFAPPLGHAHSAAEEDAAPGAVDAITRLGGLEERMCDDTREVFAGEVRAAADGMRNADFWKARNLIERFPDMKAPTLVVSGRDGHWFQDDEWWRSAKGAPRRFIQGDWGHVWPQNSLPDELLDGVPPAGVCEGDAWCSFALHWLGYWLGGVGSQPALSADVVKKPDVVRHRFSEWPPIAARPEVLYLADDRLSPEATDGHGTFLTAPVEPSTAMCRNELSDATTVLYESEPLHSDIDIVGNPFAYLDIESSSSGGVMNVYLLSLPPDFKCEGTMTSAHTLLARGAVDLEYHAGNFQRVAFNGGRVRVDLESTAVTVPAMHKLALAIEYAATHTSTHAPQITLRAGDRPEASHLVLPLLHGSLGGAAPTLQYPLRPFLPKLRYGGSSD